MLVGERDVEPPVDLVDVLERHVNEVLPERERRRVTGLQRDDPHPGGVLERGFGVEAVLGLPIEGPQGGEVGQVLDAGVEHVLGQHPELGAPVAEVVGPDHRVALKLQGTDERVADHGGPQVPDVHLLGDIRCRVVDDDGLRLSGDWHPEPGVIQGGCRPRGESAGCKREIQKPGAGDFDGGEKPVDVAEHGRHLLGELPRLPPELFGELHREIGLQVDAGPPAWREQRVHVSLAERVLDRRG